MLNIFKQKLKLGSNRATESNQSAVISYDDFLNELLNIRADIEKSYLVKVLIDEDVYFQKYPDVKSSKMTALKHYLDYGSIEGRDIEIGKGLSTLNIIGGEELKTLYISSQNLEKEMDEEVLICSTKSSFVEVLRAIFMCSKLKYKETDKDPLINYVIQLAEKLGITINNVQEKPLVDILTKDRQLAELTETTLEYNKFINSLCKARTDLNKGYILKLLIDDNQYFKNYPDVKKSNISAVEHYFSFGYKENRNLPIPKFIGYLGRKRKVKGNYLYFSNAPLRDGSFQYRCVFQSKKYANSLVYNSTSDIKKLIRALFLSDTLIFSRPEVDNISSYVIQLAKRIGVTVEFDFDDLLLPEYSDFLGHVRSKFSTPESANRNIISKLPYLYLADAFRCTTPLIESHLSKLGKPISIHQNKLPLSMSNLENDVIEKLKDIKERKVNIIYLSGTATHKKDYSVAHGILIKLAQMFPTKFTLTFLGNTQQNLAPFKLLLGEDNVKEIPRVNFQEMLDIIAKHDVGLVPLEKTIFNNAKSNIKFIECGSQGTPVIATDVDEFKSSILDKESGWLCSSQTEWFDTLSGIVNQKINLLPVSLNAKKQVEQEFMIGDKL